LVLRPAAFGEFQFGATGQHGRDADGDEADFGLDVSLTAPSTVRLTLSPRSFADATFVLVRTRTSAFLKLF